jgi:hypothetical protein
VLGEQEGEVEQGGGGGGGARRRRRRRKRARAERPGKRTQKHIPTP